MRARTDAGPAVPARAGEAEDALLRALERLRADLADLQLPLATAGSSRARATRTRLLTSLDDHLLPRLRTADAPVLAVVGGSTGAGKSTLVNSLVGRAVSPAGVLRPTTRQPTLVHAPEDRAWFTSRGVLPGLKRVTRRAPQVSAERVIDRTTNDPASTAAGSGILLAVDPAATPGLALLDAPDIDSVVETNREVALQLLGAADLWIFVTTPSRYGDAAPWEVLRDAVERGTAVAVVLDRAPSHPPQAVAEVRTDLVRRLTDAGLGSAPLFVLPETPLDDGLLPAAAVAPLRRWLHVVASDSRHRDLVVRRTLSGSLTSLGRRVAAVAAAAAEQEQTVTALREVLDDAYAATTADLVEGLGDGTLLIGELLGRWQELADAEALRPATAAVAGLDDAVVAAVTAHVLDGVARAREQTLAAWQAHPAGAALLRRAPRSVADPRLPADVEEAVQRLVGDWRDVLTELVRDAGQGARARARAAALGARRGSTLLAVVVLAGGGATGGRSARAADDGSVGAEARRSLEAVFGVVAVRRVVGPAQADLQRRVRGVVARERAVLAGLVPDVDAALVQRLRVPVELTLPVSSAAAQGHLLAGRHAPGGAHRVMGVDERLAALHRALAVGGDLLDRDVAERAQAVVRRGLERVEAAREVVGPASVIALAGATGSGKSSLLNAFTGLSVADVGVRRPTTSLPTAVVWGEVPDELLDWLEVPRNRRNRRDSALDAGSEDSLRGLVMVDLPDHDSTDLGNRLQVDRLVGLVDLLVWVVDPQKYADAALHSGYLRPLAGHQELLLVVLNKVDTVDAASAAACEEDMRRLLAEDGLERVHVVRTSAVTGEGLDDLRAIVTGAVAAGSASLRRTEADVEVAGAALRTGVGAEERDPRASAAVQRLVDVLSVAAGVPTVLDAVTAQELARGRHLTGWSLARWLRHLRRGRSRRAGTPPPPVDGDAREASAALRRAARASMASPTSAQRSQVAVAARAVADDVAEGLPPAWASAVRAAVGPATDEVTGQLADALDRALLTVPLAQRAPGWQQAVHAAQLVLGAVALAGLAAVLLDALGASLGALGPRLPVLLLVVGVVAGLALALICRPGARRVARRRRAQVHGALRTAVADVAGAALLDPVAVVLDRHRTTRRAIAVATSPRSRPRAGQR